MIYLDYSATTPVNDEVLDSFVKTTNLYPGNPNSLHLLGVKANNLIKAATKQIAEILRVKENEIIYTSGASESNNTVIKSFLRYQNQNKHIITTPLEHSSIIEVLEYMKKYGFIIDLVKLDQNGIVDLNDLTRLLNNDVCLVTIASVSSEAGIIQPINEISKIVKKKNNCFFHVDATQSIGKQQLDLSNIDFVSFSAHKFYGIKGIGGLIKKENVFLEPLIHGGKSTTNYRSGTPCVALIVSMAKALRIAYDSFLEKESMVIKLNNLLREQLNEIKEVVINSPQTSLANILNISIKNIKPETIQHALESHDIYISTKTACADKQNYSDAILVLTNDLDRAKTSIRISISYLTTEKDISEFIKYLKIEIEKLSPGEINEKI